MVWIVPKGIVKLLVKNPCLKVSAEFVIHCFACDKDILNPTQTADIETHIKSNNHRNCVQAYHSSLDTTQIKVLAAKSLILERHSFVQFKDSQPFCTICKQDLKFENKAIHNHGRKHKKNSTTPTNVISPESESANITETAGDSAKDYQEPTGSDFNEKLLDSEQSFDNERTFVSSSNGLLSTTLILTENESNESAKMSKKTCELTCQKNCCSIQDSAANQPKHTELVSGLSVADHFSDLVNDKENDFPPWTLSTDYNQKVILPVDNQTDILTDCNSMLELNHVKSGEETSIKCETANEHSDHNSTFSSIHDTLNASVDHSHVRLSQDCSSSQLQSIEFDKLIPTCSTPLTTTIELSDQTDSSSNSISTIELSIPTDKLKYLPECDPKHKLNKLNSKLATDDDRRIRREIIRIRCLNRLCAVDKTRQNQVIDDKEEYEKVSEQMRKYVALSKDNKNLVCKLCARSFLTNSKNLNRNIRKHMRSKCHGAELRLNDKLQDPRFVPMTPSPRKSTYSPKPRFIPRVDIKRAAKIVMKHGSSWSGVDFKLRYEIRQKIGRSMSSQLVRTIGQEELMKEFREKMCENLRDRNVFMIVDESTKGTCKDNRAGYTCAVIGSLDRDMIVYTFYLEPFEFSANGKSVVDFVDRTLEMLWPNAKESAIEQFHLFISDGASYMTNAAETLKSKYSNLTSVTCLAHALHLVCEEVKRSFPAVNKFMSLMKQVLSRSTNRVNAYLKEFDSAEQDKAASLMKELDIMTNIVISEEDIRNLNKESLVNVDSLCDQPIAPHSVHSSDETVNNEGKRKQANQPKAKKKKKTQRLPPHPIQTRWGTWVICASYYHHHLETAITFVRNLSCKSGDEDDEKRLRELKEIVDNEEVIEKIRTDLSFIYDSYCLLPLFIIELESTKLTLNQSTQIAKKATAYVDQAKSNSTFVDIDDSYATIAAKVYNKIQQLWQKNTGLTEICDRANLQPHLMYSPLVSVPCESFFSEFTHVLKTMGNANPENICKYMLLRSHFMAKFAGDKPKRIKKKNVQLAIEALKSWRDLWSTLRNSNFEIPEKPDCSFIEILPVKQAKRKTRKGNANRPAKPKKTKANNRLTVQASNRQCIIDNNYTVENNLPKLKPKAKRKSNKSSKNLVNGQIGRNQLQTKEPRRSSRQSKNPKRFEESDSETELTVSIKDLLQKKSQTINSMNTRRFLLDEFDCEM